MMLQKEVEAYSRHHVSRAKGGAIAWLVFYAVIITIGLITKAGEAGLQLAGLSLF